MLFNSIHFICFFPALICIYFLCPARWRWALLLAASYYFYMCWKVEYVGLILLSTGVDYWAALRMQAQPERKKKKKYLYLSLVSNLGLLFAFKYFNFVNDSLRAVFDSFNVFYGVPAFDVLLPVGISFYTFQTLSYTIDVYRGRTQAERHLGVFALYVSFWPQLVAGPIERSGHLLPQFKRTYDFSYDRVRDGLARILWGFFKKVVIADRLAVYVNEIFNNPGSYDGATVLLGAYFFAFQIYCDFSGYSDIAIGSAKVMGYDIMENFKRPYYSMSVSEFWRRWHISLSSWFKDYVYISLGGNRVVKWRWYYNLFVTFLVSGLWHGANWTFVVWGALHGAYLVGSIWTEGIRERAMLGAGLAQVPWLRDAWKKVVTFHLVVLGWIFFRANDVGDAFLLLGKVANLSFAEITFPILKGYWDLGLSFIFVIVLLSVEYLVKDNKLEEWLAQRSAAGRWLYYVLTLQAILWFGVFTSNEFIYFQF